VLAKVAVEAPHQRLTAQQAYAKYLGYDVEVNSSIGSAE